MTDFNAAIARQARSCPLLLVFARVTPVRTSEIREFMSGNLCRCGAYPNIVDAIKVAAAKMKGGVS